MGKVVLAIAAIIALLIVVFLVWRRRIMAQHVAALESIARGIRELRMRAHRAAPMHPVSEHSGEIPAEFSPITDELKKEGFRILGDVQEADFDGRVVGRLRWFTSADHKTYGWFGIAQGNPVMLLLSEDPGRGFAVTTRSPRAPMAVMPATVREFRTAWESGLTDALEGHRANLQAMSAPVSVTDLTGALDSLRRLKEHVAAWRAQQDPEALLEADVRNIVGEQFEDLGPSLIALVHVLEAIHTEMNRVNA